MTRAKLFSAGDWLKCERGHLAWRFTRDAYRYDPTPGLLVSADGVEPQAGVAASEALKCPVCGCSVRLTDSAN